MNSVKKDEIILFRKVQGECNVFEKMKPAFDFFKSLTPSEQEKHLLVSSDLCFKTGHKVFACVNVTLWIENFYSKLPEDSFGCFYELIDGSRTMRVHADIDADSKMTKEVGLGLINEMTQKISQRFKTPSRCLILDSCSADKTSFHVIWLDWFVRDFSTHKQLFTELGLFRDHPEIDCIYATKRSFRLLGSRKAGYLKDGITKKPMLKFLGEPPETPENDQRAKLKDSLVQFNIPKDITPLKIDTPIFNVKKRAFLVTSMMTDNKRQKRCVNTNGLDGEEEDKVKLDSGIYDIDRVRFIELVTPQILMEMFPFLTYVAGCQWNEMLSCFYMTMQNPGYPCINRLDSTFKGHTPHERNGSFCLVRFPHWMFHKRRHLIGYNPTITYEIYCLDSECKRLNDNKSLLLKSGVFPLEKFMDRKIKKQQK